MAVEGLIQAGQLRHRVTYQDRAAVNLDTYGQAPDSWNTDTQFECWALVEPLGGREGEIARQRVATASHAVTIRGPRVILPTGRFLWTDHAGTARELHVAEPARDVEGDSHHLRIVCAERVS